MTKIERWGSESAPVVVHFVEPKRPEDQAIKGVQYLDNTGCKALLDKRGKYDLPLCCGQPRCFTRNGSPSQYCKMHYLRFYYPANKY